MSQLCPHGFAPSECLICRTLGTQPQVQVQTGRSSVPNETAKGTSSSPNRRPERARPDAVYDSEARKPGRSLSSYAVLALLGVIVVVVAAWLVAGIVVGLLHALELVIVAVLAGWVGYRIGHYRGRRQRS